MTDIVERLRRWRREMERTLPAQLLTDIDDAADEIERLRAQNAALLTTGDQLRRHHADFLVALEQLMQRDDETVAKINKKAAPYEAA